MPYSYAQTTSSGTTGADHITVPFSYLSKSHVHVTLNDVLVADNTLTWLSAGMIQLPSIPGAGVAIVVYRATPIDAPLTVWDSPNILDDRDLNAANLQQLYAVQEAHDLAAQNSPVDGAAVAAEAAAAAVSAASAAASALSASAAAAIAQAVGNVESAGVTVSPAIGGWATVRAAISGLLANFANYMPTSWTLTAAGLATGGGSGAANRTITVTASSQAEAEAGTDNAKVPTSLRVFQAIAAYLIAHPPVAADPRGTGDLQPTHKTTADAGWIMWSDGTIGDASASASIRSNADTANLFALYWAFGNTVCPVTPSGHGASAAADFAAHKKIALPPAAGRFLGVAGAGSGLTSRNLAATVGQETVTITQANLPNITLHGTGSDSGNTAGSSIGDTPVFQSTGGALPSVPLGGSGTALAIMSPGAYVNVMIKL